MKLISDQELILLTGYKIGSKQKQWFQKYYGFDPAMKANGHPSVLEEHLISKPKENKPRVEPKWRVDK